MTTNNQMIGADQWATIRDTIFDCAFLLDQIRTTALNESPIAWADAPDLAARVNVLIGHLADVEELLEVVASDAPQATHVNELISHHTQVLETLRQTK